MNLGDTIRTWFNETKEATSNSIYGFFGDGNSLSTYADKRADQQEELDFNSGYKKTSIAEQLGDRALLNGQITNAQPNEGPVIEPVYSGHKFSDVPEALSGQRVAPSHNFFTTTDEDRANAVNQWRANNYQGANTGPVTVSVPQHGKQDMVEYTVGGQPPAVSG